MMGLAWREVNRNLYITDGERHCRVTGAAAAAWRGQGPSGRVVPGGPCNPAGIMEGEDAVRAAARGERFPLHLDLELTYTCNLNCRFCYSHREDLPGLLSVPEIDRLLGRAAGMGSLYLNITGGEPFSREEVIPIIEVAAGWGYAVRVLTNATLVSREHARRLAFLSPLEVVVTVYGVNARTHDRFTGVAGSFLRSLRGVYALREAGVRTRIKYVIARENADQLMAVLRLAEGIGTTVTVSPLFYPTPAGCREPVGLRIDDDTLETIILYGLYKPAGSCCAAATARMAVSPTGTVFPCPLLRLPLGNLRRQELPSIWSGPVSRQVRGAGLFNPPVICLECDLGPICPRCPAMALLEDGDVTAPSSEACRIARAYARVRPLEVRPGSGKKEIAGGRPML